MALAHFALALACLAPQDGQDPDPLESSVLSSSEQRRLNSLAQKWFEAWREWDDAEPNSRERLRANRALRSSKERFMREWQKKEEKNPLAHMGDLLAIFENVFPYEKQPTSSEMKTITPRDTEISAFDIVAPRRYDEEERYPCVMLIADRDGEGWVENEDHFDATWGEADEAEEYLFYLPKLKGGMELDPSPDTSTDAGNAKEAAAIAAVLRPAGEAQRLYRMDRNRLILDCGKGSSGFGLRMATYFPSRFAGLILRHPVDVSELRLDGLVGLPVLLLESEETKGACEDIRTRLNELEADSCVVVAADAEDLPKKIAEWAAGVERNLYRKKVVCAPTHDRFSKTYWVQANLAESIHAGLSKSELPYVEAVADREANRITVKTKNISALVLYLNDALLDLDKEFTIVLNGKAVTEKRQRNFYEMTEWLFSQFDPNYIWTSHYRTAVESEDPAGSKSGNGTDGGGR